MAIGSGIPHLSIVGVFLFHAIAVFRIAAPPLTLSIRNSVESERLGQLLSALDIRDQG
jgi:hypothetical protein